MQPTTARDAARGSGASYYETPRQASLTDVADSMGIAKATGSDLLHQAESKLVDWYLEEPPASASVNR